MSALPPGVTVEALRQAARAELARQDLLAFIEYGHRSYQAGWFHRVICDEMMEFSRAVAAQESPRLMLFAPPRHGKSEIASVRWPIWHLGHNPHHQIILASYGQDLASEHSRNARSVARDDWAAQVFPGIRPQRAVKRYYADYRRNDLDKVNQWRVAEGGQYKAVGVSSALTGHGAHILAIDDPVKGAAEADSDRVQEACWQWYTTEARTRVAPGGGIVITLTRWSNKDLAARLLKREGEKWRVVSFPAIAERDEGYRLKGEALHPERHPLEALEDIRHTIGERYFSALYQQRPIPAGGGMFRAHYWRRYSESPDVLARSLHDVVISLDAAEESHARSCNSSLQVWGRKGAAKYLLADVAGQWTYTELRSQFIQLRMRFPDATAIIEAGGHGVALAQEMETSGRFGWGITLYRPGSDARLGRVRSKQARAAYTEREAVAGNIYLPESGGWSEDWEVEHESFPRGAMKDRVDSASQVMVHWWHLDRDGEQDGLFMDALDRLLG